jgi:hypothetical protein
LPDHPGIRGMVARIPHLVRIIEERPEALPPGDRS